MSDAYKREIQADRADVDAASSLLRVIAKDVDELEPSTRVQIEIEITECSTDHD